MRALGFAVAWPHDAHPQTSDLACSHRTPCKKCTTLRSWQAHSSHGKSQPPHFTPDPSPSVKTLSSRRGAARRLLRRRGVVSWQDRVLAVSGVGLMGRDASACHTPSPSFCRSRWQRKPTRRSSLPWARSRPLTAVRQLGGHRCALAQFARRPLGAGSAGPPLPDPLHCDWEVSDSPGPTGEARLGPICTHIQPPTPLSLLSLRS